MSGKWGQKTAFLIAPAEGTQVRFAFFSEDTQVRVGKVAYFPKIIRFVATPRGGFGRIFGNNEKFFSVDLI